MRVGCLTLASSERFLDDRQIIGVCQIEKIQCAGIEPADRFVFGGGGVLRFTAPALDEPYRDLGILGDDGRQPGPERLAQTDADLLARFAHERLRSGLSRLDVTTHQVPLARIPSTAGASEAHQYAIAVDDYAGDQLQRADATACACHVHQYGGRGRTAGLVRSHIMRHVWSANCTEGGSRPSYPCPISRSLLSRRPRIHELWLTSWCKGAQN